jgi:hypothetical protein
MKEKQVKKTFLPQDIAVLAAVFAAGAACFPLGGGWGGVGVTVILCGAMMLPFYHHGYKLEGRKGTFLLKEISLSRENRDEILAFLDGKTDSLDRHPLQKGGALVNVYWRKSDGFMLARYFDYADFVKGKEYPLQEVSPQQVSLLESFATDKK